MNRPHDLPPRWAGDISKYWYLEETTLKNIPRFLPGRTHWPAGQGIPVTREYQQRDVRKSPAAGRSDGSLLALEWFREIKNEE
ncbi:MAG: hypothetical protein LBM04_00310 [Opitutaceae bacterium]|nr:hypothetical protein [Opitutaceae bacterium]